MVKNKDKKGILIDFLVVSAIVFLLIFSIGLARKILYPFDSKTSDIYITTALIPKEFEGAINCGDDLYDTLTKRKIGIVTYSKINEEDSGIRYEIYLKDAKPPRGMYLRNKNIWFEVESVCKDKDFPI